MAATPAKCRGSAWRRLCCGFCRLAGDVLGRDLRWTRCGSARLLWHLSITEGKQGARDFLEWRLWVGEWGEGRWMLHFIVARRLGLI